MYIDLRKFNYGEFTYPDADDRVKQDKSFAKDAYRNWLLENLEKIIDRQWEIEDVGVVERTGDFVRLLREAEFTYSIGAYTSSLALVGICAEDLCRFLLDNAGHSSDINQNSRINKLHDLYIIDQDARNDLHEIRKLRNSCLHFDNGFKSKDETAIRTESLTALNTLKRAYARIVGSVDYKAVDISTLSDMVGQIASEAARQGHHVGFGGLGAAEARLRNLFANVFGMDLSMDNRVEPVHRLCVYVVDELDERTDPPEATLVDQRGVPVVVDLTSDELANLKSLGVVAGDHIVVALRSVPDGLGLTGTWRLWSTVQKIG